MIRKEGKKIESFASNLILCSKSCKKDKKCVSNEISISQKL